MRIHKQDLWAVLGGCVVFCLGMAFVYGLAIFATALHAPKPVCVDAHYALGGQRPPCVIVPAKK